MGYILDTGDDLLGLERRKRSYNILDLKREDRGPNLKQKSDHIFAYADGEIEMSAEFLLHLLEYFELHPGERNALERMVRM